MLSLVAVLAQPVLLDQQYTFLLVIERVLESCRRRCVMINAGRGAMALRLRLRPMHSIGQPRRLAFQLDETCQLDIGQATRVREQTALCLLLVRCYFKLSFCWEARAAVSFCRSA